jgi:hypothetical protein
VEAGDGLSVFAPLLHGEYVSKVHAKVCAR